MWPVTRTWLNLGDHFPKDIRKKIYRSLTWIEYELVRCAHGKPFGTNGYMDRTSFAGVVASRGYLDLLKWMLSGNKANMEHAMDYALDVDRIEILKWGQDKGLRLLTQRYFSIHDRKLETIKWVYENNYGLTGVFNGRHNPQNPHQVKVVTELFLIPPEVKDKVEKILRRKTHLQIYKSEIERVVKVALILRREKLKKQREKYALGKVIQA